MVVLATFISLACFVALDYGSENLISNENQIKYQCIFRLKLKKESEFVLAYCCLLNVVCLLEKEIVQPGQSFAEVRCSYDHSNVTLKVAPYS